MSSEACEVALTKTLSISSKHGRSCIVKLIPEVVIHSTGSLRLNHSAHMFNAIDYMHGETTPQWNIDLSSLCVVISFMSRSLQVRNKRKIYCQKCRRQCICIKHLERYWLLLCWHIFFYVSKTSSLWKGYGNITTV